MRRSVHFPAMAPDTPSAAPGLLFLTMLLLVPVSLAVALRARRAAAIVGRVLDGEQPGRARRLVLQLGALGTALVLALLQPELPAVTCAALAVLGISVAILSPGFGDALCGEDGVQRGWHARRLADLEEWRLTGEHLRFRLFGEWTAVPLAPEHHAAVRARLVAACPERESPFA